MTNFRSLCAELVEALDQCQRPCGEQPESSLVWKARAALAEAYEAEANNPPEGHPDPEPFQAILRERAAALAQPEPQGPTNEELLKLIADKFGYEPTLKVGFQEVYGTTEEMVSLLRAVLARWSCPTTELVPVAERLPGPEHCDGEGRCWLLYRSASMNRTPTWSLVHRRSILDADYTHWLPHWALPVPQQEAQP